MENKKLPRYKNKFIQLWLIIGIIAGFAGVLVFSITYLNNNVLCNLDCRIQNEVSIAMVLLSLFGMFIGSLTYYFISEKYEKKIIKIQKSVSVALKFLQEEDKSVITCIINKKGKLTQSEIVKNTGLSRVKVFRILKKLESRDIIVKKPHGMTNFIELKDDLRKIFVGEI